MIKLRMEYKPLNTSPCLSKTSYQKRNKLWRQSDIFPYGVSVSLKKGSIGLSLKLYWTDCIIYDIYVKSSTFSHLINSKSVLS